jgi:hypothetical protein
MLTPTQIWIVGAAFMENPMDRPSMRGEKKRALSTLWLPCGSGKEIS